VTYRLTHLLKISVCRNRRYLAEHFSEVLEVHDNLGRTPLHYSALRNNGSDYYDMLVNFGADALAKDVVSSDIFQLQGSISSTFYALLLCTQIPTAQKIHSSFQSFLRFYHFCAIILHNFGMVKLCTFTATKKEVILQIFNLFRMATRRRTIWTRRQSSNSVTCKFLFGKGITIARRKRSLDHPRKMSKLQPVSQQSSS